MLSRAAPVLSCSRCGNLQLVFAEAKRKPKLAVNWGGIIDLRAQHIEPLTLTLSTTLTAA